MTKEKNILTTLADNPALIDAVRAVFTKQFEIPALLGAGTSDEVLGQYFRAKITGAKAVEDAFKEIAQYKTLPTTPPRENPAR